MAVCFNGGVVLGADSRTSTGSYVANRVSDKIVPIHDYVWSCRSGSAADTQAVVDYVKHYLDAHRCLSELYFYTISRFCISYSHD
jgi:20S proteasome subunit beta 1